MWTNERNSNSVRPRFDAKASEINSFQSGTSQKNRVSGDIMGFTASIAMLYPILGGIFYQPLHSFSFLVPCFFLLRVIIDYKMDNLIMRHVSSDASDDEFLQCFTVWDMSLYYADKHSASDNFCRAYHDGRVRKHVLSLVVMSCGCFKDIENCSRSEPPSISTSHTTANAKSLVKRSSSVSLINDMRDDDTENNENNFIHRCYAASAWTCGDTYTDTIDNRYVDHLPCRCEIKFNGFELAIGCSDAVIFMVIDCLVEVFCLLSLL